MSAPIIWIATPVLAAILILFFKNVKASIVLYIGICIFLAALTIIVRIDSFGENKFYEIDIPSALNILGRNFILREEDTFLIVFIYLFNAIWGISDLISDRRSRVIPYGLIYTALLLGAYAVELFLYSALIIEIAVILSIPVLVPADTKNKAGITRYFIYLTISMPFILLAGWFLAGGEIIPVNPDQLVQATILLGLGFVFWLAIFPFHSWVPVVFEETNPIDSGYVFQLLLIFIFLIILRFTDGFAWLREFNLYFQSIRFLGIIMAILGSVGVFFQQKIRKMLGYIFIHMVGVLLLTVGLSNDSGILLFSNILGVKITGFSILCLAVASVEKSGDFMSLKNFQKKTSEKISSGMGVIFSLLLLTGMPLTIGFPPTQTLYQILANHYPTIFVLLLLSNSIITIVAFKLVKEFMQVKLQYKLIKKINRDEIFLLLLIFFVFIVGFFPNVFLPKFGNLASRFDFLIK